jgi:hypothetical protein
MSRADARSRAILKYTRWPTPISAERAAWTPLLLRGLKIAAWVSVAAWLGAELLVAGFQSMTTQDSPGLLGWVLGGGALLFAWRFAAPGRSRA